MVDELMHYGVKGMRWGVRKEAEPANHRYSEKRRTQDKVIYGAGGVKRINRRMNAGDTHAKAEAKEFGRNAAIAATVTVGTVATMAALSNPNTYMNIAKLQAFVQAMPGKMMTDSYLREAASNTMGLGRYVGDVVLTQGTDGVMRLVGG